MWSHIERSPSQGVVNLYPSQTDLRLDGVPYENNMLMCLQSSVQASELTLRLLCKQAIVAADVEEAIMLAPESSVY